MNVMLTRAIELADVGGVNFSTLQLRWREVEMAQKLWLWAGTRGFHWYVPSGLAFVSAEDSPEAARDHVPISQIEGGATLLCSLQVL